MAINGNPPSLFSVPRPLETGQARADRAETFDEILKRSEASQRASLQRTVDMQIDNTEHSLRLNGLLSQHQNKMLDVATEKKMEISQKNLDVSSSAAYMSSAKKAIDKLFQ